MIVKTTLPKILICDDDRTLHLAIKTALKNHYSFSSAFHTDEMLAILKNQRFDLLLLDIEMRTPREGIEAIPRALEVQDDLLIIMFSGRTDFESVRDAMKMGATDFVAKDSGREELAHAFDRTLQTLKLKSRNHQSQFEVKKEHRVYQLIGNSPSIQKTKTFIEKAKTSAANILITGETGTGKEVVARLLRRTLSDGSLEPFVAVDSSTIQGSLAESMLFGHEKGAFTGADQSNRGLFEEANGGVIYFDELGNMPLEIQPKLLRVIQEKELMRVGGSRLIDLDFRVICATNQNIEAMVQAGQFKQDLFQRLNVLQIELPPLRERKEDIPLLLEHFSIKFADGREPLRFLPETIAQIQKLPLTGNIRELENLVLYLYTLSETAEISPLDLPPQFLKAENQNLPQVPTNFYEAVQSFEREFLNRQYAEHKGNVSKMALELGMDRSYLHQKLKSLGIHQAKKGTV